MYKDEEGYFVTGWDANYNIPYEFDIATEVDSMQLAELADYIKLRE